MTTDIFQGYMSGALTGISQPEILKARYELLAKLCAREGVCLYLPHQHTDPANTPKVKPSDIYLIDRHRVVTSDLMLAYVGEKSFGVGMELEMATAAGVPVVLIGQQGQTISRIVRGCPAVFAEVSFESDSDLQEKLAPCLRRLVLVLREPKPDAASYAPGKVLRKLMRNKGVSRITLSQAIGTSPDYLKQFEFQPLSVSNPSWLWLHRLTQALGCELLDLIGANVSSYTPELEAYAREANLSYVDYSALKAVAARDGKAMSVDDWRRVHHELKATVPGQHQTGQATLPL